MPKPMGATDGEFSVVVFFPEDTSTYVKAWVNAEEAAEAFRHYTDPSRPAQKLEIIRRVIITDGMDCTCMEWEFGKGVTFPTVEQLDAADIDYNFESDSSEELPSSH